MDFSPTLLSLTAAYGWHDALTMETTGQRIALMEFNGADRMTLKAEYDKGYDERIAWSDYLHGVKTARAALAAELDPHRGRGLLAAVTWDDGLTLIQAENLPSARSAHWEWVKALRPDLTGTA